MKRIFLLFALLVGFAACKDEKEQHVTYIDDMIYFVKTSAVAVGDYTVIEPMTSTEAEADSSLELEVARNMFIAKEYPKQTVDVKVDEAKSTAVEGDDFELSATSLDFDGADKFRLPLTVDIGAAAGKKIVLNLVYPEYPSCPVSGRREDRLEITIK